MYASTDASSLTEETVIAQAITEMWYNGELDLYPSNAYGQANPDFSNFEAWGHYSQIVWVGSTQVGCAAQYCAPGKMNPTMGAWYSVCNYFPAGMSSTLPYNMLMRRLTDARKRQRCLWQKRVATHQAGHRQRQCRGLRSVS
jgi:hypothetical protein